MINEQLKDDLLAHASAVRGCRVSFSSPSPYMNYQKDLENDSKRICVAPIKDYGVLPVPEGKIGAEGETHEIDASAAYFTAMHEVGHAQGKQVDGLSIFATNTQVLDEEGRAWLWAFRNAATPPTDVAKRFIRACLTGYMDANPVVKTPPRFAHAWKETEV
jgi:hypothetical protein